MKIAENSNLRLVLRDRTLWITAVCFLAAGFMTYIGLVQHRPANVHITVAIVIVFGLAFLHQTDVVFDKERQVVSLRKLTVIRLRRATFRFEDIADVAVQISPMIDYSDPIPCRLALVTREVTLPMTAAYEPGLERYQAMRDEVLRALGRPTQEATAASASDPVRQLVQDGRILDAVALLRMREKLDLTTARKRVAELQKQLDRT